MGPLGSLFFWSVLLLSTASAQKENGTVRRLQPWLMGLTAVVGFLFIVFILMIINRIWCHKNRSDDEPEAFQDPYYSMRNTEQMGHTNEAMEPDFKEQKEKEEMKMTSM
ncbi:small integral membrane protein 24 [Ornithorhynchus anatinus]|uniref:Small integral membrane protein 24 n=1 Tax=Ornithorhynchus anatinus TaxID=9258 RepID=A0A6I8PD20_ORNAN|nr:small integral membrane protein 24 [Ornithorhynchus anatinus]XP_028909019.1 small integral membrane protein 24 [Ornithorhynchus anatinus]